ncbi:Zn-dependent exopeptidase [Ramaria rubella]|nr:Zn-dependent exopeptidase [Ramaria rubella]
MVYVQEAGVEETIRNGQGTFAESLDTFVTRALTTLQAAKVSEKQTVLTKSEVAILYRTPSSALISVPEALLAQLDILLPRLIVPVVLSAAPLSLQPVPSGAVERVSEWLAGLSINPDIAGIVAQMQNDIRYLTGEDEASGIISRHSFSKGAQVAGKWIQAQIENTGATCESRPFLTGFAPNVICRYPPSVNTTGTIILSAHYDSRGSYGSVRAPGGDDDGSGVLSILAIARAIKSKGISFDSNVELVAFAGEEQGLLGSRAYAKELQQAGANVTLMIQADMLAFHKPDEPSQLGLPAVIGTPEVAQLVGNVSNIYSPELSVGYSPACCSDHQSFHELGFPATQVFERAGPIVDPMYHNSGDLSNRTGYDLEQVRSITKATFATLLHTAGFNMIPEA